jgi:hypothetical protein
VIVNRRYETEDRREEARDRKQKTEDGRHEFFESLRRRSYRHSVSCLLFSALAGPHPRSLSLRRLRASLGPQALLIERQPSNQPDLSTVILSPVS